MNFNIDDTEDLNEAFNQIGYLMLKENASNEEIEEAIKEALDEYLVLDSGLSRDISDEEDADEIDQLYLEETVEEDILKIASSFWEENLDLEIEDYVDGLYMDELRDNLNMTYDQFKKAAISQMAIGIYDYNLEKEVIENSFGNITLEEINSQLDSIEEQYDFRR